MSTKIKLALVAFDSLGDGLVHAMMAENFAQNGFEVTYFYDLVSAIDHWLPNFRALPYPSINDFERTLDRFDVVLMSPPRFIRNLPKEEVERLACKYIFFCQKVDIFGGTIIP
ncbi:MAG: NAD(P)-binding domain-containing protein [Lentisphaerales bacterium]|nr:NAD(P)-binding domain-containing protein [Lentisphaerales bacterium]